MHKVLRSFAFLHLYDSEFYAYLCKYVNLTERSAGVSDVR